jgi:hypothetical protein
MSGALCLRSYVYIRFDKTKVLVCRITFPRHELICKAFRCEAQIKQGSQSPMDPGTCIGTMIIPSGCSETVSYLASGPREMSL